MLALHEGKLILINKKVIITHHFKLGCEGGEEKGGSRGNLQLDHLNLCPELCSFGRTLWIDLCTCWIKGLCSISKKVEAHSCYTGHLCGSKVSTKLRVRMQLRPIMCSSLDG